MSKVYTFALAGQSEVLDNIVASFGQIMDMRTSKEFANSEDYKMKNKLLSEAIAKYCFEENGKEYTGLDMLKNAMNRKASFKETFDTVVAAMITPILPKLTSDRYQTLYDVTQVGFGDNAKYTVESNELFIVQEGAEGIARGGIQTMYNTEYTVKASKKTITVGLDWYHMASGVLDWGNWGLKIARSFEAYINASVIKSLEKVIKTPDELKSHGIAGYVANGISDTNWLTVARNVRLANGDAPVYAMGTDLALAEVLPEATEGFRFGSTDDYVVKGHLPMYKSVPLIGIDNALVPNTINGTPKTTVADDYIYMIALGGYKPVHVVFEGDTVQVNEDGVNSTDNTYAMTIDVRIGVDVIVGSKFGAILK